MKAVLIILAALFALAHPVAVAVAFGAVLAACGASAWIVWRAFRYRPGPCPWRTA